jgi:2-phosphoglycerate kinase
LSKATRVVLIGGTSHAGKSSTASALAARWGAEAISTDKLARHPGRPWPTPTWVVPDHVAEHYATLTAEELIASVMAHYGRIWPMVRELIETRAADAGAPTLVLEGSALWPELVAELKLPTVRAVWLTADDAVFDARIRRESRFDQADPAGRQLIESFAARTRLYNATMMQAVKRLGLPFLTVTAEMTEDEVVDACLAKLGVVGSASGDAAL